jgi:hypothetical protein
MTMTMTMTKVPIPKKYHSNVFGVDDVHSGNWWGKPAVASLSRLLGLGL